MVITVFWTVLSGVVLYIASRYFDEYVLKPRVEYKQLRSEAAYCLTYYGDAIGNPEPMQNGVEPNSHRVEAQDETRKIASKIEAYALRYPKGRLGVPNQKKLLNAKGGFIGISNLVFSGASSAVEHICKYREQIETTFSFEKP